MSIPTPGISGLPELRAQLAALTKDLYGDEAARIYLAAARRIRDAARRKAPVSKWPIVSRWHRDNGRTPRRPAGALREAIIAYDLSGKRKQYAVAAKAQVNIFKGRARAPHGHLVEFGTGGARVSKSGGIMPFPSIGGGRVIFARKVDRMPANPFFRSAIESDGGQALAAALRAHQRILERNGVRTK